MITPVQVLTQLCMTTPVQVLKTQLENVAIANALQLEAARRRFNFVARAKFELGLPNAAVLEHFYCLYVMLCFDL